MINFLANKFNLFKKINLLLIMIPNDFINDLWMQSALKISFYKDKDHLVCLFQKPPHFSRFPMAAYIIINNRIANEINYYCLSISRQFSN